MSSSKRGRATHGTNPSSNNAAQKLDRIAGSGRVTRVSAKFAYITSETHGSIFVLPPVVDIDEPNDKIIDLHNYLRIDAVVHFTAVPQNGPHNCGWMATKVTGASLQLPPKADEKGESNKTGSTNEDADYPPVIENIRGTVYEINDRFGYIWSEKFGSIYLPLNACFSKSGGESKWTEFQKLTDCFLPDDVVDFNAERQPITNGCKYKATSVKLNTEFYAFGADSTSSSEANGNSSAVDLPFEVGVVGKLYPIFGFIHCEKLGNVFFTLSNYVASADDLSTITVLTDVLSEGVAVRFMPSPQVEKNGCVWRALRVQKVSPNGLTGDDFEDLVKYLKLDDDNDTNTLMEVACQTDQSLWNSFLIAQSLPSANYRRQNVKNNVDVECQTAQPPEMLVLKALKNDTAFRDELKAKFPDLMKYVEKSFC